MFFFEVGGGNKFFVCGGEGSGKLQGCNCNLHCFPPLHPRNTRNYCWWKNSCTTWDEQKLVNNGINYQPQLVNAGFLNISSSFKKIRSMPINMHPSATFPQNFPCFQFHESFTVNLERNHGNLRVPAQMPPPKKWGLVKGLLRDHGGFLGLWHPIEILSLPIVGVWGIRWNRAMVIVSPPRPGVVGPFFGL